MDTDGYLTFISTHPPKNTTMSQKFLKQFFDLCRVGQFFMIEAGTWRWIMIDIIAQNEPWKQETVGSQVLLGDTRIWKPNVADCHPTALL